MTDPAALGSCGVPHCFPPNILNGTVDPHGLTTAVYFQWGIDNYGSTTASRITTGNTYERVSADAFVGPGPRVYQFRIVATNSAGTSYGNRMTFHGPCCE